MAELDDSRSGERRTLDQQTAMIGLQLLLRARVYAVDAKMGVWEFALEIEEFYKFGLDVSDLRWMVAKGLVKHAVEVSACGDPQRSFESRNGLKFERNSCFVISDSGIEESSAIQNQIPLFHRPNPTAMNRCTWGEESRSTSSPDLHPVPTWDSVSRELHYGRYLVKRFRVPAQNQELSLEVFEEEGWPECIDDPIPPKQNIDSKTRLHDAINRLNGSQINPAIRFFGSGNGKGIGWRPIPAFIRAFAE